MDRAQPEADLLELTVLAFLCERPLHPYDAQRTIRQRHKDYAMERSRALYRAFERLARQGWIEAIETSREGRRPERTVYRITPEGIDEFRSRLTVLLERPLAEYPAFQAALGYLAYLTPPRAAEALADRTVALEGEIAGIEVGLEGARERLRLPRMVLLEIEFKLAQRRSELEWVRSLLEEIRSGRLAWDLESLARHFQEERPGRTLPEGALEVR